MIDSNNKLKSLSRALLESAQKILSEKKDVGDLAKKAPPYDKVTHADVLVGRGVYSHGDVVKHKAKKGMKEDAELVVIHAPVLGDIHGELAEVLKRDPRDKTIHVQCEGMKYILKSGQYRELDEAVKSPYAVGMAAAMKSTGDTPPLKKSTITKAHEIAKKVDEETEELDELSKGTLGKYIKASAKDQRGRMYSSAVVDSDKNKSAIKNRVKGLTRATDKLTKEEVELDESKAHYMSGFNSEKSGKQRKHNPFKEGSSAAHHWAKGWEHSNDGKQPQKFVNEETEELDELSRKTLSSYVKKSVPDMRSLEDRSDRLHQKGHDTYKAGATKTSDTMLSKSQKLLDKSTKRGEGINRALNKLAKEEVELDELSKGTLGSYIKKAGRSAANFDDSADNMRKVSDKFKNQTNKDMANRNADEFDKKSEKRLKGIVKASGKLTKEEVELDELSRKTLGSYVKKASRDLDGLSYNQGVKDALNDKPSTVLSRKTDNKVKGITRAADRLTKEEVEFDEGTMTPYVKPHIEKGSTKQSGWKASNKHGKVKYFGSDFKKSAEKHAGIAEEVEGLDELSKSTLGSYIKKASPSAIQKGIEHGTKKAERDEMDRVMNRHMSFSDKDKIHDTMKTTHKDVDKPRQKALRRNQGIIRAVNRITKEEVEFSQEEIDFIEATMSDLDDSED